ncbi:MAG TPA: radical SAM protein [Oligoflexia bacterium]|nr:radical SAM protein [Oligoflexia bacterium]
MNKRILLVQPPIYDFSAYDFWLKPYGLLRIGGMLRHRAEIRLFDYLDRAHPCAPVDLRSDKWGCGAYRAEEAPKPSVLSSIPRRYRRYGLPRTVFQDFLRDHGDFNYVLINGAMTYWYPGIQEVLEDARRFAPRAKTIIGGRYAEICPVHACSLAPDFVVSSSANALFNDVLRLEPERGQPPFWNGYAKLTTGVISLTAGCPYSCTYCALPQRKEPFSIQPIERTARELVFLLERGATNVAFYDDALLFRSSEGLIPFLRFAASLGSDVAFHTPNALHARLVTPQAADAMAACGMHRIFLGFESTSRAWHERTGGKLAYDEFKNAVQIMLRAGLQRPLITAYLMLGHPLQTLQDLELSIRAVHELGIRVMLSEFSPIPGTPDGERCRELVDLDEPLWHNKTAFPLKLLGSEEVNRWKTLVRELNEKL